MKQLRRKMFWTLFAVLLLLAVSLTGFADYRDYVDKKNNVSSELLKVTNALDRVYKANSVFYAFSDLESAEDDFEDKFFVVNDLPVYWAIVSRDKQVQAIFSYNATGDEDADAAASALAKRIVERESVGDMHVGNLFDGCYAWFYSSPNTITILDISSISKKLCQGLLWSIPALAVEILIIYYVSRKLTKWMITPIEEAFEKQKQFVADASHELKTPLAVIMANAEAMERDPDPKWLKNIETESDRMNRLIKELLDLTRSEQEKLNLQRVDLSFLSEKEISIQEAVLFEKGIELKSDIPPEVMVEGEPKLIEQVVEILLDNAISHTKGLIQVRLETERNYAVLRVENNGELIPEDEREKIFERFYRSDKSRNRNENRYGLGLAIARNLMSRMNGTIGDDVQNGLTSFYIRLKLAGKEKESKDS